MQLRRLFIGGHIEAVLGQSEGGGETAEIPPAVLM
jgi:hypothetical protein